MSLFITEFDEQCLKGKIQIINNQFVKYKIQEEIQIYKKATIQELLKLSGLASDKNYLQFTDILMFHRFVPEFLSNHLIQADVLKKTIIHNSKTPPHVSFANFRVPNTTIAINKIINLYQQLEREKNLKISAFWQFKTPAFLIFILPLVIYDDQDISNYNKISELRNEISEIFKISGFTPYR